MPALIDPRRVAELVVTDVAATADALGGVGAVEMTFAVSCTGLARVCPNVSV